MTREQYSTKAQLETRKVSYQRVGVNQALAANGIYTVVVALPVGAKTIQIAWNANAAVSVGLCAVDANGNTLTSTTMYLNGTNMNSGNFAKAGMVISELGGNPNVMLLVSEKSAAANVLNYVDIWATGA